MGLEVKEAEKMRRCNACLSEENLRKIEMGSDKYQLLSLHLCLKCCNSFIEQIKNLGM